MKRVLIAASAAVLLLTGCGGGEETAADEATVPASAAAPAETEAADEAATDGAEGATDRMAVNDKVRTACEEAIVQRLPGAEFPSRAVLRAASTEAGKLYTVSGAAQAGGTEHPYTCDVTVGGENEVTVDATTVDGQ